MRQREKHHMSDDWSDDRTFTRILIFALVFWIAVICAIGFAVYKTLNHFGIL